MTIYLCFIDDKRSLQGQSLSGLKFTPHRAAAKLGKFGIEEVLLAMPSVGRARKKRLLSLLIRQMSKLWNCQG